LTVRPSTVAQPHTEIRQGIERECNLQRLTGGRPMNRAVAIIRQSSGVEHLRSLSVNCTAAIKHLSRGSNRPRNFIPPPAKTTIPRIVEVKRLNVERQRDAISRIDRKERMTCIEKRQCFLAKVLQCVVHPQRRAAQQ